MVDFKVIKEEALQMGKARKATKQGESTLEEKESDIAVEGIKIAILNAVLVKKEKTNPKYVCMIKINTSFTRI